MSSKLEKPLCLPPPPCVSWADGRYSVNVLWNAPLSGFVCFLPWGSFTFFFWVLSPEVSSGGLIWFRLSCSGKELSQEAPGGPQRIPSAGARGPVAHPAGCSASHPLSNGRAVVASRADHSLASVA